MSLVRKFNKVILISYLLSLMLLTCSFIAGYSFETQYTTTEQKYTFSEIFINNTQISFLLFAGIFTLGLLNIVIGLVNGFAIGSIMNYAFSELQPLEIFLKLVPHGFFEIPSLILSISIGFLPLLIIFDRGHGKNNVSIKFYLKYVFFSLIAVLGLNAIAAFIETSISM